MDGGGGPYVDFGVDNGWGSECWFEVQKRTMDPLLFHFILSFSIPNDLFLRKEQDNFSILWKVFVVNNIYWYWCITLGRRCHWCL